MQRVQDAIVVATTERDNLDAHLAATLKELEQSAGNRQQVDEELAMLAARNKELEAEHEAIEHAKRAAEDKVIALESQMEALQVCPWPCLSIACLAPP
jgi:chromosome segregation ATPase